MPWWGWVLQWLFYVALVGTVEFARENPQIQSHSSLATWLQWVEVVIMGYGLCIGSALNILLFRAGWNFIEKRVARAWQ
jgi:hypothetical protein